MIRLKDISDKVLSYHPNPRIDLIEKARKQAQTIFAQDANLEKEEHQLLGEALDRFWGKTKGDVS